MERLLLTRKPLNARKRKSRPPLHLVSGSLLRFSIQLLLCLIEKGRRRRLKKKQHIQSPERKCPLFNSTSFNLNPLIFLRHPCLKKR